MRLHTFGWLILLTLGAFLMRWPYWEVIPASFDEVNQTVFAHTMLQTGNFPPVANDAYTGAAYVTFLAVWLQLGVTNPMLGRVVVLIAGTLCVPLTFSWVSVLADSRRAGWLAAVLVAINPDLILVNSHIGGATFLLPFFTTAFLWSLTVAQQRDSRRWLIFSGLCGGLVLQVNLVGGLVVAGGLVWLLWKTRDRPQLGWCWPVWPVMVGLLVLLIISPVLLYNLTSQNTSVAVLQERSYLWEENPSVATTINNLNRLTLQSVRQTAGVVSGDEGWGSLLGVPLLFAGMMFAGLVYTTRHVSFLPLLLLLPFWLIFPVFSSHYGFINVGRFTTLLVPIWAGLIGILGDASIPYLLREKRWRAGLLRGAGIGLALALLIWPPYSLFQYYARINAAGESGAAQLALSRHIAVQNQGEPVYLSSIEGLAFLRGVPYVPHATLLLNDIEHEFLPAPQILGRLYAEPRARYLLLSSADAAFLQEVVLLERVDLPANGEAEARGYGLYWLDPAMVVPRPAFVIPSAARPELAGSPTLYDGQVKLWGCDAEEAASPTQLQVDCYFERVGEIPSGEYVGFAQLVEPGVPGTVGQDDHVLGRQRYPLSVWRLEEIVVERFTVPLPAEWIEGEYLLLVGIYTWPEQRRLPIEGAPDNVRVFELNVLIGEGG